MPRVFISASSEDRPFVERLKRDLAAAGIETDAADDSIQLGESIANRVTQGIERADNVIAVLSNSAAKSSWFSTEIALALAQQERDHHTRLLPVLAEENAPPSFFLRDFLYLDMSSPKKYESAIPRLIKSITHPPRSTEDRALILQRRVDTLTAERTVLETAKKMHAEVFEAQSNRFVSAIAGSAVVLAAIVGLVAIFAWRDEGISKFGWFSAVVGIASSVISGLLSNFFYGRLEKRQEHREALDE